MIAGLLPFTLVFLAMFTPEKAVAGRKNKKKREKSAHYQIYHIKISRSLLAMFTPEKAVAGRKTKKSEESAHYQIH